MSDVETNGPAETVALRNSSGKLTNAIFGWIVVIAIGIVFASGVIGDGPHYGPYAGLARPVGLLFLIGGGLFLVLAVVDLFRLKQPVIVLTPQGLNDTKLSPTPIPWSTITAVEPFIYRGNPTGVVLRLAPEFRKSLRLGIRPLVIGRLFKMTGPDFVVSDQGSADISRKDYYQLLLDHWTKYAHPAKGTPTHV